MAIGHANAGDIVDLRPGARSKTGTNDRDREIRFFRSSSPRGPRRRGATLPSASGLDRATAPTRKVADRSVCGGAAKLAKSLQKP